MRNGMMLTGLLLAFLFAGHAMGAATVSVECPRQAFYRDEEALLTVRAANDVDTGRPDVRLDLVAGGVAVVSEAWAAGPAGDRQGSSFRLPCARLRPGEYECAAVLAAGTEEIGRATFHLSIAERPNPERLMIWLWGGGGSAWYLDHGFTTWSGPRFTSALDDKVCRALDQGLLAGADVGIGPNGGLRDLDPGTIADADAVNLAVRNTEEKKVANPLHPEVARIQDRDNTRLMEFVLRFPQVRTAFFNTEIVDSLGNNINKAGLELTRDVLGFSEQEIGPAAFAAPGVISDEDRKYVFHKFKYKQGNGLTAANRRTAETVHRYRPDILTISDPFRETALLDLFPGLDVIGTWTYTNPDPKLMLYVETLRAACRPTGQIPLNTVTLLNYPGELAPTGEWMLMGPGRLTVATWINLSRAQKILGYYYSSECNPVDADSNKVPYSTSLALKNLSEKVFKPYGPLLSNLEVSPRRIAVLSSAAARVHSSSPSLLGGYANLQIYHFYSVMAMAHLQADVVFDETIERYGLDAYDMLALPKCDVLTKQVYDEVLRFRERGGLVIADQYLGPEIPGALKFDFDFTYRNKVSANALAKNVAFADWNDHIQPGSAEMKQVEGVTALDDQRIMESYAAKLRETLGDRAPRNVDCDSPNVLVNLLEKNGVTYLVLVNDKRTYDEREGKYKAVLGKLLPQTARITLLDRTTPVVAYDLLERKRLDVSRDGHGASVFSVDLDELGGKIVALYPAEFAEIGMHAPKEAKLGSGCFVSINMRDRDGAPLRGLQPLEFELRRPSGTRSEYSGYYCAKDGALTLRLVPALNDETGRWTISVNDLTAGLHAEAGFEVVN